MRLRGRRGALERPAAELGVAAGITVHDVNRLGCAEELREAADEVWRALDDLPARIPISMQVMAARLALAARRAAELLEEPR